MLPGLGKPVAPAGRFTGWTMGAAFAPGPGRSPRIRAWTVAMQPRHLPYPGRCCVVPAYTETGPCMTFMFVGSWLCTQTSFRQCLAAPPLSSA